MEIVGGATSRLIDVFIQDSSVATGAGLTGLVFNTASLVAYYHRDNAASAVAITLATMTLGTWATGGFVVVDGTNMPGMYSLGIPDAALAAGAKSVTIILKGATNMAPMVLRIDITATDNQDAVRGGMTALPNANANASNGLPTAGTGTNQISLASGLVTLAGVTHTGAVIPTVTTTTTVTNVTNAPTNGDLTATMKASITAAVPTAATIATTVWAVLTSALTTAGSVGKLIVDNLDAVISAIKAKTDTIPVSPASTTNITAGTITTVTNLTNAATNGDLTNVMKTSVQTAATAATPIAASVSGNVSGSVASVGGNVGGNVVGSVGSVASGVTVSTNNDKTGYGLSAAAIQAIWDALTSALTTAGSIGKLLVDNINATISSRMATFVYTAPPTVAAIRAEMDGNSTQLAKLGSPVATVSADIAAIKSDTGNIGTAGAGLTAVGDTRIATINTNVASILADVGTSGVVLSTATLQAIADMLLKRGGAHVDGVAERGSLYELIQINTKAVSAGTTLTIYLTDGVTVFGTRTLTLDTNALPVAGIS